MSNCDNTQLVYCEFFVVGRKRPQFMPMMDNLNQKYEIADRPGLT